MTFKKKNTGKTMVLATILLLVVSECLLPIGISASGTKSPWQMYGADCRHSKLSTYSTSLNNGTVLWTFDINESTTPYTSVIDSSGVIYVSDIVKSLYAINPNGSEKWHADFDSGPGTPALSPNEETVYIDCWDGKLYALDSSTGRIEWNYSTGSHVDCAPTVTEDGTIYFGSGDGNLYALNPDGSLKWSFDTGAPLYRSSPAVSENGMVIFAGKGSIYALNPDGSENWSLNISTEAIYKDISIGSDGTIYFAYGGEWTEAGFKPGKLYAINPNGSVRWIFSDNDSFGEPAIGPDGTVYIDGHKGLYAVSPDGDKKWLFEVQNSPPISPSIAIDKNGIIYYGVSGSQPTINSVNPNGSLRWKFETANTSKDEFLSPISIGKDGTVYVGVSGQNSILYAIGSSADTTGNSTTAGSPAWPYFAISGAVVLILLVVAAAWVWKKKRAGKKVREENRGGNDKYD